MSRFQLDRYLPLGKEVVDQEMTIEDTKVVITRDIAITVETTSRGIIIVTII